MLSPKDLKRLESLMLVERKGLTSELVSRVMTELRANGVGQKRDPREIPRTTGTLRVYELFYQPPGPLCEAEIIHALFPSPRMRIADRVLAELLEEIGGGESGTTIVRQ